MSKKGTSRVLVADPDPAVTVTSVAAGVSKDQAYVAPTDAERLDAGIGLARLAIGDLDGAAELLGPLGFTVTTDVDPATGRRYALAVSETQTPRAWGLYLVDLTRPLGLCVAVPHPKSDALCEQLALRLWRATPGAMLAMAAVHRDAAEDTADHSQNTESVFHHLWTDVIGPRGAPQVQVHGFADATAPEQVVVSTGRGSVTPAAVRISDEIQATGLVTTRSWTVQQISTCARPTTSRASRPTPTAGSGCTSSTTGRSATHQPCGSPPSTASPRRTPHCSPTTGRLRAARGTSPSRWVRRTPQARRGSLRARITHTVARRRHTPTRSRSPVRPGHPDRRGHGQHRRLARRLLPGPPSRQPDARRTHQRCRRQRVLVEALADAGRRTLTLDASYVRSTGIASAISIPSGKRWFGQLVNVQALGWVVIASAVQA